MSEKIRKSEAEWRAALSEEQFQVTRKGGTERPYTGKYYQHKAPGRYRCVACGAELFDARHKYDSDSGWPSYWAPARAEAIETHEDRSLGMARTEVRCARCEAHLGHVFPDGPQPSGLRYCINSAALDFEPDSA